MEKRPRGGRKKKAAAEAKAATNEANKAGNECDKAKEPLKMEQRVASKFKPGTLRWSETVLEAGLNDLTSYSLGVMTHATQAKKQPDFIGDAFYYNLTNRAVSEPFNHTRGTSGLCLNRPWMILKASILLCTPVLWTVPATNSRCLLPSLPTLGETRSLLLQTDRLETAS
jgi:hypothetical protein